jgi:acetoin utilization protein AcuB
VEKSVKNFMSGGPVAIELDAPALAALDLMVDHGFRHLPVLGPQREVVGVVSFDDLRAALPFAVSLSSPPPAESRRGSLDVRIADIMNDPIVAGPDVPLTEAVRKILDHRIGCLPVVDDDGVLVGILTERDLLEALMTVLWADSLGEPTHEE